MGPKIADAGISKIGQIALTVKELPRAVGFYRDILGLEYLFKASNMAFFDCGGTRIMLEAAESRDSTYNSILYYKTDDIHGACVSLKARGVQFEAEPRMIAQMPDHELWMAFLRDSEGNLLALMSEVR
ncbi:MAG TPA: VOC family protein [Bryobacteraceae bacterium]|nr:VOC family protein [Bryobacteraceae bacterium]